MKNLLKVLFTIVALLVAGNGMAQESQDISPCECACCNTEQSLDWVEFLLLEEYNEIGQTIMPYPEMAIGGRVYEILDFLRADEKFVNNATMVARAEEMNAKLGKEDGEFILEHQGDITVSFREEVVFIFADWRYRGSNPEIMYGVDWGIDHRWVRRQLIIMFGGKWDGHYRLLRRKS